MNGHCCISRCQIWIALRRALTLAVVLSFPAISLADEGGVSFWLPGLFGSLAAVPPQPGWAAVHTPDGLPVTAIVAAVIGAAVLWPYLLLFT